jgi:hypothetical protein
VAPVLEPGRHKAQEELSRANATFLPEEGICHTSALARHQRSHYRFIRLLHARNDGAAFAALAERRFLAREKARFPEDAELFQSNPSGTSAIFLVSHALPPRRGADFPMISRFFGRSFCHDALQAAVFRFGGGGLFSVGRGDDDLRGN